MRTLSLLIVWVLLLLPATVCGTIHTIGPNDTLAVAWYTYGPTDTIGLLPGTYQVGGPTWQWILWLTKDSPSLIGCGDAEDVILLGTGQESAFWIAASVYDAHIDLRRLTFRSLGQIFKRGSIDCGGSLTFTDNIVEDCRSAYAVDVRSCAPSLVARNVVRNNTGVGFYTYHNSGVFEDNEICFNAGGIRGGCCENPTVRRNHIHHNGWGISPGTFYFTVLNNLIEYNGTLGVYANEYCRIEGNVIRYNQVGIRAYRTNCSCRYNDIYGNTDFNLETTGTYGNISSWNCSNNWWGTTDPAAIAASIRDCQDDSALKLCVQFEPWCDSPGCAATPVHKKTWGSIKAMYR